MTPAWYAIAMWAWFCPIGVSAAEIEITEGLVIQRFARGQEFDRDGFVAQALKEYLWCFDEGMPAFPRFKAVRTGLLMNSIKHLADSYDPAQQAMEKRCAEAQKRVLAGELDASAEFAAWCAALNDERRMLKVFDQIPPSDPRRHGFGVAGFRALLAKRRYADALSALPYDAMVRLAETKTAMLANSPQASTESREAVTSELLDYIEVLAGAKAAAETAEMIAKLRAFDPSAATRRDIERRLKRAG